MTEALIIIVMAIVIVLLVALLMRKISRIQELEAQLDHAKKAMQGVTDAIREKKKIEAEAEKPETVPPAVAGDAASRLDRLSKL